MEPMFLPDVESHPPSAPYADLFRGMRSAPEYPQIWHLFAFRPEATDHLRRFTQEIVRGPAPLTPGLRELIAAYTSSQNNCAFCAESHVAFAAGYLQDEDLVRSVLRDLEHSALTDQEKALFRFIHKVNAAPSRIAETDVQVLRDAGWTDEQIYYAISVCALFNFYNRWVSATGVHPMSPEGNRDGAARMAVTGYAASAPSASA
jgi:uncharacterized peroxidase-related enzyme